MAEVIDLISSSPPRPLTVTSFSKQVHSTKDVFDFGSDDFDITGGLDFAIEQQPKRRRLSPAPATLARPNTSKSQDSVFELSSEPDGLPDLLDLVSQTAKPAESTRLFVSGHEHDTIDIDLPLFSSSAPEPLMSKPKKAQFALDMVDECDKITEDPILSSSQTQLVLDKQPVFSERTAGLLARTKIKPRALIPRSGSAELPTKSFRRVNTTHSKTSESEVERSDRFKKAAKAVVDDILDSSQPGPSTKKIATSTRVTSEAREDMTAERATSKAAKMAEKEIEKEKRRRAKEEKQQEKQRAADLAEVNKSKTNKKNSTPEMVLLMPTSLQGKSLGNQVEEYMKQLEVEMTYVEDQAEEVDLTADSQAIAASGSVIEWRRKVKSEYDIDEEEWHPLPAPRVSAEEHIIIFFKAEDFVTLAVIGKSPNIQSADVSSISEGIMKSNLDQHLATIRKQYPSCRPIYLIEGLVAWHKRSQNAKNRAYTAAVRSQPDINSNTDPPASSQPRRRKKTSNPVIDLSSITDETTENLLLHLQLHHQPLQIHHTTSPATSAAQISTFTQHLSTRPYRLAAQNANLASASFCMTTGQIRTGSTANETWINMLQEINRVTPSMAYGISGAGYTNPLELVQGFRKDGREMLQDVRKSVNKDGGWSDRKLGPMVSKRVYKVFMGKDPAARDGIA